MEASCLLFLAQDILTYLKQLPSLMELFVFQLPLGLLIFLNGTHAKHFQRNSFILLQLKTIKQCGGNLQEINP